MHNVGIKLNCGDRVWNSYIEKVASVALVTLIYDDKESEDLTNIDFLIATSASIHEIEVMKKLKAIFLYKTGVDRLPVALIKAKGIDIFPSHVNAGVIAEHAISLALCLLHRINEFDADLRRGCWYSDGCNYYWRSLAKMEVGIIGYGHIGRELAKKISCMAKGIRVFSRSETLITDFDVAINLEDLVSRSDIVFLCLPKNQDTIGLINKDILARMAGKYLVNISRAEICNEVDLFHALSKNQIAGYASDVWYDSPNKQNKLELINPSKLPFELLRNVVMTPHCATHEMDAHERYISDAVESCLNYLKGYDETVL